MHPTPITVTTAATPSVGMLPQILPLKLGVVSTKPGLGQSVQIRLDEMTPQLYLVSQVETLADLEAALHLGAVQRYPLVVCLIDVAFPPFLNQSNNYYAWLARLSRTIAVVEEDPVSPHRVETLCRQGFLATLSLNVPGWVLYDLLAQLLQQAVVLNAHTEVIGLSSRCPSCQASVPNAARFCWDCGVRLPVSEAQVTVHR